jgi:hypothetical protein
VPVRSSGRGDHTPVRHLRGIDLREGEGAEDVDHNLDVDLADAPERAPVERVLVAAFHLPLPEAIPARAGPCRAACRARGTTAVRTLTTQPRNVTSALFSHRAYTRCAGVAASKQDAAAAPLLRPKPRSQIPDDRLTARRQDDASVPRVELRDWHSIPAGLMGSPRIWHGHCGQSRVEGFNRSSAGPRQ